MIRGEIWLDDFGIPTGSEAGYRHPAVVIQNNYFKKATFQHALLFLLQVI
jgi:mRNA-degrading endonuclease toxin of MazEF toxin-antitoxin module